MTGGAIVGASASGDVHQAHGVAFGRALADDAPVPAAAYVVGEEPWWDEAAWSAALASSSSLRAQLRRAKAKGVAVARVSPADLDAAREGAPSLRAQADALVAHWLRTRHMAPLSFAAEVAPFADLERRVILVATRGDRLEGLASCRPLATPGAWVIEHVLREPKAPNGTAELLVDAAMRALFESGAREVTLGLAPLFGRVPPFLALTARLTRGLFDFRGLADFKAKLRPKAWRRVLVEHPGVGPVRGTLRALRAFAGGSVVFFGLRSALRGPPPVIRLIAALLVPWTIGLALVDTARFFPSPLVQWAWVVFDVLLALGLFWLARRIGRRSRKRWLHAALATLVTLDAIVTTVEAALLVHARGALLTAGDRAIVAAACLAPAGAAVLLWCALRHRP